MSDFIDGDFDGVPSNFRETDGDGDGNAPRTPHDIKRKRARLQWELMDEIFPTRCHVCCVCIRVRGLFVFLLVACLYVCTRAMCLR